MATRRIFLTGTAAGLAALALPRVVRADAHLQLTGGREPRDATALTAEERLHLPALAMPERVHPGRAFDLVVRVGVDVHPMDAAHHVDRVEVALDGALAWAVDLSPHVPFPVLRIPLLLAADATRAQLDVRARCTQHGVWLTRRALELA